MQNCYSNSTYMHGYCSTCIYYFISFFFSLCLVFGALLFLIFSLCAWETWQNQCLSLSIGSHLYRINKRLEQPEFNDWSNQIGAIELVNDRRMEVSSSSSVVMTISSSLTIGATWAAVSSSSLTGASSSSLCSCSGSVLAIAFGFLLWCCREWFKNSEDS